MRQGSTLYFLHGDHLGSTSLLTNSSGQKVPNSDAWYYPYGELRPGSGNPLTDYRFTGQRSESTIGLYDYGARFYDPALGRFISADTIVPGAGNPQALNRYSYVLNNPLRYRDPSGHQGHDPNENPPHWVPPTNPNDNPPPTLPPLISPSASGAAFPMPVPDLNDTVNMWIYQALLMIWQQGGSIGREWVMRWLANPPGIQVLDLNEFIANTPAGVDILGFKPKETLEYIQRNLGSGQWYGVVFIAVEWLKEKPDAWRASVLIHEFVHTEQYRAAYRAGIKIADAGRGTLEKERGAEFVQYSIIYHMNDQNAINSALGRRGSRDELAVEICKLVTSRSLAYNAILGRNDFYISWPPTLGNPGGFPIGY
ncbi:MAG: RHS repeat-associated core domain-containing protein [Chloroflexi bacterium]|nr:RHS repeat-associated core domain-containing protein [Chloroflexota bacterium]